MAGRTRASRIAAVRVHAFAKINLTLRVLGIRSDGYHELRTAFQSLAVHDTLTCTTIDGPFTIECQAEGVPCDASNLIWRAAESLWRSGTGKGPLRGVRVRLDKRIPMQAGLGGGSSDAAAALRALAVLWRLRPAPRDLHRMARDLGADVPYFLLGGTALGVDRGDLLFPLEDQPRWWVVLVLPDFGVSTKEAYGWWDADHAAAATVETPGALERGLPAGDWRNDLEAPVVRRRPAIGRMTDALRRLGAAYSAMSGSGSAVFGLFESERTAARAARAMADGRSQVVMTRSLRRRPFTTQSVPATATAR